MSEINKKRVQALVNSLFDIDQCEPEWDQAAADAYNAMASGHREVLKQLVETGPVWDGDVIAKSYRDDLLEWKLATRVVVRNEQGFTGATYTGWSVLKRGSEAAFVDGAKSNG